MTLSELSKALSGALDLARIRRRAEALTASGVYYGEANFAKNAAICEGYLRESGFKRIETIPIPCDGKTAHLDCIMPQSWDRTGRSFFKIVTPDADGNETMVCDTDESPYAIGMWSMPTPKEGVTAEIVDWDSLDPAAPDVTGKTVLIFRKDFIDAYRACCERKAAAILMCDSWRPDRTPDTYRWCNGIRRIGWYHEKRDPRCVFFNITPRRAARIRERNLDIVTEPGCLSDDTFMSAPLLDVPSNWIHNSDNEVHHNSSPLFFAADWTAARQASTALGSAAAALATFGKEEAESILPDLSKVSSKVFAELADGIVADTRKSEEKGGSMGAFYLEKLDFFLNAEKARLRLFGRLFRAKAGLAEAGARLDAIAAKARAAIGTPPFPHENPQTYLARNLAIEPLVPGIIMSQARVPWAKRVANPGFPDYEIVQAYCDGKGTLGDAIRKCEFVTGHRFSAAETKNAIAFFRLLAKYGYFRITTKHRTTPAQLCEVLRGLGVVPGSKVMVHSSFSALGEMRGGPEAVAKALMRLVTSKGLLLMPAFNFYNFDEDGVFDPEKTRSRCGTLTEAFRKMPGVLRSLNPTNSFAAWGAAAEEYISRHHEVSVMGADSPLGKLERDNGLIVMIECPASATFMHVVEFTNNVKCFDQFGEEYPVRLPGGEVRKYKTWAWRNGECKVGELGQTWRLMRERNLVKTAKFANATIIAYRPADFRTCYEEALHGPDGCATCPILPRHH